MITQFGPAGHTHRLSMIGRVRRWSLWSLPQYAIGYFLTVELLTVALASVVIAHATVTRADLGRFALLVVVGLCYAEASDRVDPRKVASDLRSAADHIEARVRGADAKPKSKPKPRSPATAAKRSEAATKAARTRAANARKRSASATKAAATRRAKTRKKP